MVWSDEERHECRLLARPWDELAPAERAEAVRRALARGARDGRTMFESHPSRAAGWLTLQHAAGPYSYSVVFTGPTGEDAKTVHYWRNRLPYGLFDNDPRVKAYVAGWVTTWLDLAIHAGTL